MKSAIESISAMFCGIGLGLAVFGFYLVCFTKHPYIPCFTLMLYGMTFLLEGVIINVAYWKREHIRWHEAEQKRNTLHQIKQIATYRK